MRATLSAITFCGALGIAAAVPDAAHAGFANCSLHGEYVYQNIASDVVSFGVVKLDGKGGILMDLRVNTPSSKSASGRETRTVTAQGTYKVEPSGLGTAEVNFVGMPYPKGTHDFVIERVEKGLGTRVFTALGEGGVNGQMVNSIWTLRSALVKFLECSRIIDASPWVFFLYHSCILHIELG